MPKNLQNYSNFAAIMNREILRIAIPNIISNITVPLMGIVSTAIASRACGGAGSEAIGALSIGVTIFNFIFVVFKHGITYQFHYII